MKREVKTPDALARDWGVTVDDLDALANHTEPVAPLTEEGVVVTERWVRLVAEEYFRVCADAIRRHDPNHLVLGNRFAGSAPDIWDIAGEHCDIVSFNMYPRIDVERGVPLSVVETIEGWHEACRKPMMITEWSFPALDSGLPCKHGAGMRVDTQTQRTQCFNHFQTMLFSLPFMVGSDFFMFVDEPALGISESFPEDTNYGLVNEDDEPYPELTAAAASLNPRVYELHQTVSMPQGLRPIQLAPWLTQLPSEQVDLPFTPGLQGYASGGLALVGGSLEIRGWQLSIDGTELGVWYPLMHQVVAQDLWVSPDFAEITAEYRNETVTVVEVMFELKHGGEAITEVDQDSGAMAVQSDRPQPFCSAWRLWIPTEGEFFASQCLWVENTGEAAWCLAEIFHYTVPSIGGDSTDDVPLGDEVPNYYLKGDAWVDAKAGLGLGCWYTDAEAFTCHFWKDPNGGFHGDLRTRVDVLLKPGQRFDAPDAIAFFFPLKEPTRTGLAEAIEKCQAKSTK